MRFAGFQEVFANEAADEKRSLGEVEPPGERDGAGNRYSHGPVTTFWYSLGYSQDQR